MNDMFEAKVIQFMRPHGRQVPQNRLLPVEHEHLYDSMKGSDCWFECEVLTTGVVSFTISNGEEDLDISLSRNGPEVDDGIIAMLKREKWKGGS